MSQYDLRDFAATHERPARMPTHRPGERFIKGPIPFDWFSAAARMRGRELHVGMIVWFFAGMAGRADVGVSLAGMRSLGVSRTTASRALANLERAGLVSVTRANGRKVRVTLLPAPAAATPAGAENAK